VKNNYRSVAVAEALQLEDRPTLRQSWTSISYETHNVPAYKLDTSATSLGVGDPHVALRYGSFPDRWAFASIIIIAPYFHCACTLLFLSSIKILTSSLDLATPISYKEAIIWRSDDVFRCMFFSVQIPVYI